ncbi:hypothetical protein ISF_09845 [Cordyceps fumosorosea ARSEF 2679]|uniref:AMP-dependent synthetase/ligase n=1 Tax=Cordyceps fumosorosea (strain ARSEF 2679) TaxID=1081104 RepID=A0A167B8F5_CORFA|nr:hypothetical protein ISF_09845 [Cordyceps fumosorosea ARSEF 2679]OAA39766.1 hypothetical protein ISF_09845 [Cordyceps fumosorosea ARSEF 2679]
MPPSATLTSVFFARACSSSALAVREANDATDYHELASKARNFAMQLSNMLRKDTKRVILVCTRGIDAIAVLLGAMSCGVQCIPILPERPITAAYLGGLCGSLGTQYVACTPQAEMPAGVKDICIVRLEPRLQGGERAEAWLDKARPDGDAIGLLRPGKSKTDHFAKSPGAQLIIDTARENFGIEPGCQVLVLSSLLDISILAILSCLCHGGTLVIQGGLSYEQTSQINVLFSSPAVLAGCRPDRFPRLRTVAAGPGQLSRNLTHRWTQVNACVWSLTQAQDRYDVPMRRYPAVERTIIQWQTEHSMLQRLEDCAAANHLLALEDSVWYVETLDIHGTLHSFIVPDDLNLNKLKSNLVTRQPQLAGRVRLHARARLPVRVDGTLDISALKGEVACLEGAVAAPKRPMVAQGATCTLFRLLCTVPMASMVAMLVNVSLLPIVTRQTKSIYTLAAANVSMTMLSQQDAFISLVYLVLHPCMSDGPAARFLPLWVKRQMAGVFCNRAMVHATLAAWSMFWLLWFSIEQTVSSWASPVSASASSLVIAVATWTLLVAYICLGLASVPLLWGSPSENRVLCMVHKSGGLAVWLMALALAVVQAAIGRDQGVMAGRRIGGTLEVWLLAAPLVSLGVPWLTLRRVTARRKWSAPDRQGWEIVTGGRQLASGARRWMTASSPLSSNWHCAVAVASSGGCNGWIAIVDVGMLGNCSPQSQSLPGHDRLQRTFWIQQLPVFRILSATRFFQSVVVLAIGKGILAVAGKTPRYVVWSAAKQDFDNLDKKLGTRQLRKVPHTASQQELSQVVVEEAKRGGAEAIFVIGSATTVVKVVGRLRTVSSLSVYVETCN